MNDPRIELVKIVMEKKLECLHLALSRDGDDDPLGTAKKYFAWLDESIEKTPTE